MDNETALKLSIEHWERMIKWAGNQNKNKKSGKKIMLAEIGENWYGDFCELCKTNMEYYCNKCILAQKFGDCCGILPTPDNKNHWYKMVLSETWGEWVDNAKIFLIQLKSLEE